MSFWTMNLSKIRQGIASFISPSPTTEAHFTQEIQSNVPNNSSKAVHAPPPTIPGHMNTITTNQHMVSSQSQLPFYHTSNYMHSTLPLVSRPQINGQYFMVPPSNFTPAIPYYPVSGSTQVPTLLPSQTTNQHHLSSEQQIANQIPMEVHLPSPTLDKNTLQLQTHLSPEKNQTLAFTPTFSNQVGSAQPDIPLTGPYVNRDTQYVCLSDLPEGKWNTTPQGNFALDVSHSEYEGSGKFQVDWACQTSSGRKRKGASYASSYLENGHRTYRQCLGTIHCGNKDCAVTIRPHTHTRAAILKQLNHSCKCGNRELIHNPCPNKAAIIQWSGGVRYMNGIHDHNHEVPSYKLHLTQDETAEFVQFVKSNPQVAPAALISGNTVDGKTVTDISSVLIHAPRVGRMRNQILGQAKIKGGDDFIEAFMHFQLERPGFIVANTMLGGVTVISAQTPFMASQLHDEALQVDGPFNGIISDAAHGWWKVQTSLLIISSVFSQILLRWIPVLISYSNGASAAHYEYHFLALFESIARIVGERNKTLVDELLAGVVDFSEAERTGFVNAFVRFWLKHTNLRDESELRKRGDELLRGCLQHFQCSITRVKRIAAIVPVEQQLHFAKKVNRLLQAKDSNDFNQLAKTLEADFPKIRPWLHWWLRPEHASMLFQAKRNMDPLLWHSLPETTNAEESIHFSMYAQQGRKHAFFAGWEALWKIVQTYEKLFNAERIGQPTHWGKPPLHVRQALKAKIGRTKRSRALKAIKIRKQQYHNDGRPPDDNRLLRQKLNSKAKSSLTSRKQRVFKPVKTKTLATSFHIDDWSGITKTDEPSQPNAEEWTGITGGTVEWNEISDKSQENAGGTIEGLHGGTVISSSSAFMKQWLTQGTKTPEVQALWIYPQSLPVNSPNKSEASSPVLQIPHDALARYSKDTLVENVNRDFCLKQVESRSTILVSSTLKMIPSYKWADNSCWLDTSLEVLFWLLNCNWNEVALVFETSSAEHHLFHPIYCLLRARRLLLVGSNKDIQDQLTSHRESIRQYIKEDKSNVLSYGGSTTSVDSLMTWFSACIDIPINHPNTVTDTQKSASHLFAAYSISIRYCNATPVHIQLTSPHPGPAPRATQGPFAHQWSSCQGYFQDWIRNLTTINKSLDQCAGQQIRCWRQSCNDTQKTQLVDIIIGLPVFWCVTIHPEDNQLWDFPRILYPVAGDEAKKHQFVYEMTARVFSNQNHFVTRFATSLDTPKHATGVFFYDGMQHGGQAQRESGKLDHLLGGRFPVMPEDYQNLGYRTCAVMYHLKGGTAAQAWFSNRQISLLQKHLQVSITPNTSSRYPLLNASTLFLAPKFSLIPLNNQTWLSSGELKKYRNRGNAPIEYQDFQAQTLPLSTPYKTPSVASSISSAPHSTMSIDSDEYATILQDITGDSAHPQSPTDVNVFSSSPPPSSPAHVICRCGVETDGHQQEAISGRIFNGKGVLVRDGLFFFPARLIQKGHKFCSIRWWRHNIPAPGSSQQPGKIAKVSIEDIKDELWQNRAARRRIRLGKWVRAFIAEEQAEAAWEDPKFLPFSSEIDRALQPNIGILTQLMNNPDSVIDSLCPAKKWQAGMKRATKAIEHSGGLTVDDCARINNWFYTVIPGASQKQHIWIGALPIAHARTLVLLHRHQSEFIHEVEGASIVELAFNRLVAWTGKTVDGKDKLYERVDVDLEALQLLEKSVFDISEDAGVAGNQQWGLDAGSHLQNWNPWLEYGPESHCTNKREGDDEVECQHGPDFIDDQKQHLINTFSNQPKARPNQVKKRWINDDNLAKENSKKQKMNV
ncbi:uncharacterized protein C8R40DRAFT_1171405 [Lentinula edodes]|uniref:uncharacterized protein n=1 Tax=Lentinula edodes TaxID=5353 RepID=UPI001E8DD625|nr:uncharacterized protein C8R40DRAFT_1171401 [Lentinula edodes]XP_046085401.1 uncharacterized protein C8R40DRAFT_1171405 [Lentinula edodes]KAH7874303.1 hypothetical protein C8R40DRAFT_1171401 [Lentinula edodes]KAH7874307.1 hypothetical protein C8R40DRAFT_1171405 [Lentinula edodes]